MCYRSHALIHASGIGDIHLVKKLIMRGANPSFSGSKYYSWEKALIKNHLEIANYLLNLSTHIESSDFNKVMRILISRQNIEGVKIVLKYCKTISFDWILYSNNRSFNIL